MGSEKDREVLVFFDQSNFFRPERLRSGLFVLLLLILPINISAQLPSNSLSEVFSNPPDLVSQAVRTHDTGAKAVTRIYGSASYYDLYRKTVKETTGSKSLLDNTAFYSRSGDAGIAFERKWWGALANAGAGKINGSWQEHDNDYAISGNVLLNTLNGAGWVENRYGRLLLGLGYVPGLPYDLKIANSVLQDRRLSHFISGTAYYRNSYVTIYETRQSLFAANARIENRSNHAAVEIPLLAGKRETGFELGIEFDNNRLGIRNVVNTISSDSSFSGNSLLPAGLAGSGYCRGVFIDLPLLPLKPKGECNLCRYRLNAHGYDYTDTNRYLYLENNDLVFTQGRLSFATPWNVNAGFYGEYGSCNSNQIGRLDPYVFSSFTIFDPTKYRIDTAWAEYQAAGFYLERGFRPFNRDSMNTAFSMAYVTFEGSLHTRDIVFIAGFIPDLANPRDLHLSFNEMLLLTPEINYTFRCKSFAWKIGLRQLIPIELSPGKKKANGPSPAATKQSAWGGTTIKTGIEYSLQEDPR